MWRMLSEGKKNRSQLPMQKWLSEFDNVAVCIDSIEINVPVPCSLVVFFKEKVWNENSSPSRVPKRGEYNKNDFVSSEKCTFHESYFQNKLLKKQLMEQKSNHLEMEVFWQLWIEKNTYTEWKPWLRSVLFLDQQPPGGYSKPQKTQWGGPHQTVQRSPVQVRSSHRAHQRGQQQPFETNWSSLLKLFRCNTLRVNALATTGRQTQADRSRSRQKQGGDGAQVSAPNHRNGGADEKAQGRLQFRMLMLCIHTMKKLLLLLFFPLSLSEPVRPDHRWEGLAAQREQEERDGGCGTLADGGT